MRFAVIAAGEGSRLAQEGVEQPKPLVPLCGEPMIERLLRIFVDCGATEIVVIVNEWSTAVREHLEQMQLPVPLRLVVKTTPSSMHSLHALSPYLRGERFCLTTVDTIFREEEFKKYIRYFQNAKDIDGCMAVTPYVDDEKPLWVGVEKQADAEGASLLDKQGSHKKPRITGFHDKQEGDDHLISGGIYCLGDKALDVLDHCMEQDMSRIESGKTTLSIEKMNLPQQISQLDGMIRQQAGQRCQNFTVSTHLQHENVLADPNRLNQVLMNILSNAVKYTPRGGHIRFEAEELPRNEHYAKYQFIVQDDGIGMSEAYQKTLFDPFTREERSGTNKVQGTGLGMAITKNIVDLMGGSISVESANSGGWGRPAGFRAGDGWRR